MNFTINQVACKLVNCVPVSKSTYFLQSTLIKGRVQASQADIINKVHVAEKTQTIYNTKFAIFKYVMAYSIAAD